MSEHGDVKMKKHYYSWQDVEKAADSITTQMYKDLWMPDYIVGITRGGLPLATILSHKLDVRLEALKVKLHNVKPGESNETNCWMSEDAFGYNYPEESGVTGARWDIKLRKNILVVDDFNHTGETLNWIKQDWQSTCLPNEDAAWDSVWGKSVRFAVMTENLNSQFTQVNYCYHEVNQGEENVRYIYPYQSD